MALVEKVCVPQGMNLTLVGQIVSAETLKRQESIPRSPTPVHARLLRSQRMASGVSRGINADIVRSIYANPKRH